MCRGVRRQKAARVHAPKPDPATPVRASLLARALLALLGMWWLFYRKKYDRTAVVVYYIIGVLFADVFCALLIVVMYRQNPGILSAPAWLMPIGGITGLLYGATKGRLAKRTPPAQ
jgi:hypothetical protein